MDMGHPQIADIYRGLQEVPPLLRLDVFPGQFAPLFTARSTLPQLFKWGFDGPYGKQLLINARAETVTEKPFFAHDFAACRCAVPCNGFYEWDENKQKHLFVRPNGKILYLAGFCKQQDVERFIILTKPATLPVSKFHHRIPVLLDRNEVDDYLNDSVFATEVNARDNPIELLAVKKA